MNLKVSKLLILFVTICIGVAFKSYADTNLGNGASFSGKVKKGQLVGNGVLTLRDLNNRTVLTISGAFSPLENGKTLVSGTAKLSKEKLNFEIPNATFELNPNRLDTIQVKKGYEVNLEWLPIFSSTRDEEGLEDVIGKTEADEIIIVSPETRSLVFPRGYTKFSLNKNFKNMPTCGYGIWGYMPFIEICSDSTHCKVYELDSYYNDSYVLREITDGDDYVLFKRSNLGHIRPLSEFSRSIKDKKLSGKFIEYVKINGEGAWAGTVEYGKYSGTYKDGNNVYRGEFLLPALKAYQPNVLNEIDPTKFPEFITVTREGSNDKKNHKRLTLTEGGTVLNHIKPNEINTVDSLTIVGIMYPSDMKIIGEMMSLEYLDLSNVFITYSPQEKKEREADRKFEEAFLKMISNANEAKRASREMSQSQYEKNKFLLDILDKSKEVEPKTDPCFVPTINKMLNLKTLILPKSAQWIAKEAFMNCENLETVVLPEYLEEIRESSFSNCKKLKHIKIPKSLKSLGTNAFSGCPVLEELGF